MKDSSLLLAGIDHYIKLHEKNRKTLLNFNISTLGAKKKGLDYGSIREQAFGKIPEEINGVLIDELIEDLADWRRAKTFYSLERAEEVVQNLAKLNIEIPEYLGTCYNEVKERNALIQRIENKGLKWSEYSKNRFLKELEKELIEYTLDEESKSVRLRELFFQRVETLKRYNKTVLDNFGFYIDALFEEDNFVSDYFGLNTYFFEGEKKQQTVKAFGVLQRTLIDYFHLKKEILFLQDLVQGRQTLDFLDMAIKGSSEKINSGFPKINFDSTETKEKVFTALKGFFPGREDSLNKVLGGQKIEEKLLFPNQQNSFSEVFSRLSYNNKILNEFTEIRDWICTYFQFRYKKGTTEEIKDFNKSSVYDTLRRKTEPTKRNRILQDLDWLPFIHKETLKENIQKEK